MNKEKVRTDLSLSKELSYLLRHCPESKHLTMDKHGWVKIHHDNIYGSFIGDKDWTEYPYCPTQEQIKWICKYADKF